MEKDLVIGVDASTTWCKAIVWDLQGSPVARGRVEIPLLRSRPEWHEQDARDWWRALAQLLRIATTKVDPDRLAGLCICPCLSAFICAYYVAKWN